MKQVTVKEARNILGDDAANMSDDEVQDLIDNLSLTAKRALQEVAGQRMQNSPNTIERSKNDSTEI